MKTNDNRVLLKTKKTRLKHFGLQVRYAELGDPTNPSLLLLHGVPENLHAWYAVAPELSKEYHILALDWPGFGGSDSFRESANYNPKTFAEVGIDFLRTLQIKKAHLMATDIGLSPALIMAIDQPDLIDRIVVMDGIPFPTTAYSSWELKSFGRKNSIRARALIQWFPRISAQIAYKKGFYKGQNIPKAVQQEFLKDGYDKATQLAFLSYFRNNVPGQAYLEQHIQKLVHPVLVVWGEHDRFINPALGQRMEERLPNAHLELIKDSGHFVHMDRPQALLKVSKEFLSRKPEPLKKVI